MPANPMRFGDDFDFDLRAYELRRAGQSLKLERIPMDLLHLLLEQRGQLVTRDQIVERIWGQDVYVDTDNSINAAMRKVRQVLDDDPEQPRFIQTVTGKGYRFIAPVETIDRRNPQVVSGETPPAAANPVPAELVPLAQKSDLKWRLLLPGIAILLLASLGAYFQWRRPQARPPAPSQRLMLAVLPFENLTGDFSQDYFSDGMTEEMIAQLGRLDPQHLGVIARTSVMHYKRSQAPLDQIAHELGVGYVLEGSVRRDSEKVRITVQLIQMRDQTHLWAHQYDREQSNLFALQDEIAQEVAGEIQLALNGRTRTGPIKASTSPKTSEAYELYLKGQYFWNKRTVQGFQQAIEYFQQATAKDPNYARAYAGLADSYALMSGYTGGSPTEFIPKARAAALRALEIDESLPEAHTALALIVQNYDWDWPTAEKEYRRAIELNPNYATAHHWYAEHLALTGRFDEALRESERARQLDPLSLIIAADNGAILYFFRQYDRAIEQFRAVLEMEPNFPRAHLLIFAYVQKGQFADALADIEKMRRIEDTPWNWQVLAYVYGRSGQQPQAQHALEMLEQLNRRQRVDPAALLVAHIGMGDKGQALFWLEKAYAQHSNVITTLKVDPIYDPLRSDPRFQDLLHRVGLAQ
jgi:TolB-like protein/DNA-binding winged helix-turn-helix (wHTH) protein/Tfp pilus assembly protein PilF